MRRSDLLIRIATGLFFAAVMAYLGLYLYQAVYDPFKTTVAVEFTVYDSVKVNGVIIRNETVLESDNEIVFVFAAEGKRVAAFSEIATAYESKAEMEREAERRSLTTQIERLENISDGSTRLADPVKLDSQIQKDILNLKRAVNAGELNYVKDMSDSLLTLAHSGSLERGDLHGLLDSLNERLYNLGSPNSGGRTIYAPASGLFTRSVDGYEDVSPTDLSSLNAAALSSLASRGRMTNNRAIGKLVFGTKWYYAVNIPAVDAKRLRTWSPDMPFESSSFAEVIFGKYYSEKLQMKVESVGLDENGFCPVILSCDYAMADTLAMRVQGAEIVKSSYSGVRVPKRAVHLSEDGSPCVYIVTGLQAELKTIVIIYETADFYIVENDPDNERGLRAGDTIIVSAKNLYDGKVIKR